MFEFRCRFFDDREFMKFFWRDRKRRGANEMSFAKVLFGDHFGRPFYEEFYAQEKKMVS